MCNFFSFVSDGNGNIYYFNSKQREELKDFDFDSHTTIACYHLKDNHANDRVNKYEYSKGKFTIGKINVNDDSKRVERWLKKFVKTDEFKRICLITVEQDYRTLQFVPDEFKSENLCLTAVKQDGWALKFIPDENEMETRELCFIAVSLKFIPDELKTEKMCLIAVKQDGLSLQFVPDELKTEEICLAALEQNKCAFQFVPDELKEKIKSMI